jgi:hypothetical protein
MSSATTGSWLPAPETQQQKKKKKNKKKKKKNKRVPMCESHNMQASNDIAALPQQGAATPAVCVAALTLLAAALRQQCAALSVLLPPLKQASTNLAGQHKSRRRRFLGMDLLLLGARGACGCWVSLRLILLLLLPLTHHAPAPLNLA